MRRQRLVAAALVFLACQGSRGSGGIGPVGEGPAATLLLPHFEVDLDSQNGVQTLFSINNASARAAVAHVTPWTAPSIPPLDFDVYLPGYDVQTITLYDIFPFGNLPRTADAGADPADTANP